MKANRNFSPSRCGRLLAALTVALAIPAHSANLILEEWAGTVDIKDIAGKIEDISSLKEQDEYKAELQAVLLSSWTVRDLAGALRWFGERGGADQIHQQARDALALAMARKDPADMMAEMEKSLPGPVRKELYLPLFQRLAGRDPAGAAALLRRLITSEQGNSIEPGSNWADLAGQVAAQWANTDVRSAVDWAQSLPDGLARSRALALVSYKWTESNPLEAATFSSGHGDSCLLANVATKWAESDPVNASAWLLGLDAGEGRDNAIVNITTIWCQKNPRAAASYTSRLPIGTVQDQAVIAAVAAWAEASPAQAAQWVGKFVENPLREQALQTLMKAWVGTNPVEAQQWLKDLPPTPSRNAAATAFSELRRQMNSEAAGR